MSMFLALLIGIPTGILSAVKKGTVTDYIANIIALSGCRSRTSARHHDDPAVLVKLMATSLSYVSLSSTRSSRSER